MSRVTPIGTTKRERLTARQALSMLEAYDHKCALCGLPIDPLKPWIDEHLRALGLAGSNAFKNRAPACVPCAEAKTKDDMARINKAKDQKAKHYGLKPPGAQEIKSAGFRQFEHPSKVGAERTKKVQLPPRRLYEGESDG